MAEQTLIELINNNKHILTTKITKGTIQKFIQLVCEDKLAKYIDILRVITIFMGKPLSTNQREIS
jgi:RIH domain